MQLKSALSNFAAFTLLILSFTMIACASPAPAPPALAVARSGEPNNVNGLVARGDVSDQCLDLVVKLKADVDIFIGDLDKCYGTPSCDPKPIIVNIVARIRACIDLIVKLQGTILIKLDVIIKVVVDIIIALATACGKWVIKLGLDVYLTIFVDIDVVLCALINALVVLEGSIKLKLKLLLVVQVQLLITACFNGLIKILALHVNKLAIESYDKYPRAQVVRDLSAHPDHGLIFGSGCRSRDLHSHSATRATPGFSLLSHVNMGAPDLRLGDFIPGLLVPPEANVHLTIGIHFLLAALYTLTITSRPRTYAVIRILLGIPAGYIFYHYAFHPYDAPRRSVETGLAVVGLYGIMRVIDTCLVDLLVGVHTPPRWVVDGKVLPLPTTFFGRIGYSVDYLLSLRGTSIFKNTTWDWIVPSAKRRMPPPTTPRITFICSAMWSLTKQYIVYDTLDALNKSRVWDTNLPYPITNGGLSVPEQLVFAFSVCAGTALSISVPATLVAIISVASGAPVEAWPPMFDAPFSAISLADFWTRRWHSLFRRVFDRLSLGILHGLEKVHAPLPLRLRKTLRAVLIFGLSATLHLLLMYRLPISDTHYHPAFFDHSIMMFFLSQPAALLVERMIVEPLAGGNVWVTRAWAWGWLLCSGRWWADVWVRRGLWDPKEKVVGYSVVRGLLYGNWTP
ncbi:hypothetical protein CTheo_4739 [Ceratobasidium theobromae]|uniref:Wax synthase domain-containing protein n=1 Tax=Ceratobasidium theobromae TaxID=1582974 RepID=A0A5N5QK60_9AGAM|nr:hypothetical protein CTheo_4739 [Ceratobasidium theobromae]